MTTQTPGLGDAVRRPPAGPGSNRTPEWLTPGEVAALLRVDPKTVGRWAADGRIHSIRTPGNHRRFRATEIQALLEGPPTTQ